MNLCWMLENLLLITNMRYYHFNLMQEVPVSEIETSCHACLNNPLVNNLVIKAVYQKLWRAYFGKMAIKSLPIAKKYEKFL